MCRVSIDMVTCVGRLCGVSVCVLNVRRLRSLLCCVRLVLSRFGL